MTPPAAFDVNTHPVGPTPLSTPEARPQILMCPPKYYDVVYSINPWMQPDLQKADVSLAQRQWEDLHTIIAARADVHILEPREGLPDMVFTANAAFVHTNTAVIARYRYPERQPEEPDCEAWFRERGFHTISPPMPFEGAGDALILDDSIHPGQRKVLAGYRTRSDISSHMLLSEVSGYPVLSLELTVPSYYHIDVCLCPLKGGYLLYSPAAFDTYGLQVIEANVPEAKRIPVTEEEGAEFACNAVNLGDDVVMNQLACGTERLKEALAEKGFNLVATPLSEYLKAGGSAKCLTLRVG